MVNKKTQCNNFKILIEHKQFFMGKNMNYKELNRIQRKKVNSIIRNTYTMEWEDPKFMYYLLGELPEIRKFESDKEAEKEINQLERILDSYDPFMSNNKVFLEKITKKIAEIKSIKLNWYGLDSQVIKKYMDIHRFCLIFGEGGVGKTYFVKCFEEKLEEKNIPHLCIYGKFEKNTANIDVEEIIETSNRGFVFIVDAINEMTSNGQKELLNIIETLRSYSQIRIVITYRTHSMDDTILERFKSMAKYEYKFPGVSFESALNDINKLQIPDVYMYEDILYSNNALLLSLLCNVLSSEKLTNETENSIASVTFILEQYIKKTIEKNFKKNASGLGIKVWRDTKKIAKWMYTNEKKSIDEDSLLSVTETGKDFIISMVQMGFLDSYELYNKQFYFFVIDSLTDFLISRSFFEDIKGKSYNEQVEIIKSKVNISYNLSEALILAIFDNMSPDYKKIERLLTDTDLIYSLDPETITKIHFKNSDIPKFLEVFKARSGSKLLKAVGGYTDKPFNCRNYLYNYFCSKNDRVVELSNTMEGFNFQTSIKNRLKNILYFITLNNKEDRRYEEAFYFSLLCCAAPNKNIRCLAIKLLYEIVSKDESYIHRIIFEYSKVSDYYIQEAMIYILSKQRAGNNEIIKFYNEIIKGESNITAKSIRRISTYFGSPYEYIKWNRKNLYRYSNDASISDCLEHALLCVDLWDKDSLPFRYFGREHIEINDRFVINDKDDIAIINGYLKEKYNCVSEGNCSGLYSFEEMIKKEIEPMVEIKTIEINSFFKSLDDVLSTIFKFYNIKNENRSTHIRGEDFAHSTYRKCIDIAIGIYYGSLMCNYFTSKFATYNNIQNSIGYEVYDPLEYGEEVNIISPIPMYNDRIERLEEFVINSLELPIDNHSKWARNTEITRKNLLHLLDEIEYKNTKWVVLACRVLLRGTYDNEKKWEDTYTLFCCASKKETILEDGNARYLTIELDEYNDNLKYYSDNNCKPWLCKCVDCISSNTDVFEETRLVLPPSVIIDQFKLKLNCSDISWENQFEEKIIVCSNAKNSYYENPIGSTVFMRKDYYDKFLETNELKYFAFSERYTPETGYAEETSLHFEIIQGRIVKEIGNNTFKKLGNNNLKCRTCKYQNI